MDSLKQDKYWMGAALHQAEAAAEMGEVPVGAVIVHSNQLLASAGNMPITLNDPTAHAEIRALRQAAEKVGNYRLSDATLYVTLEPCIMCAGAMIHARVSRVVYGASDPKTGALRSLYRIGSDGNLNHRLDVTGGVESEKCAALLKQFFAERRKKAS